MKKRFTEAQIVGFLRQGDAGATMKDPCRRQGFFEGSCYLWRSKFGGMRIAVRDGLPIRDASPGDKTRWFLNTERTLRKAHGWTFDDATNYWNPHKL